VLRTHAEVDLRDAGAVEALLGETKPEVLILAAARVGGIGANMADPVGFLVENLEIQNNLLLGAQRHGVALTMFLGSSCIYPRLAPQPMSEDVFMTGPVEPTNESYAIAKIAGIRLLQALHQQHGMRVINAMPCNVYGPGDHFEFERSHVMSALVRRFVEAKASGAPSITLWGTGSARRELLHVDDLADALLFLLDNHADPAILNVGSGVDHSIAELAALVRGATGYEGDIEWDTSKPDGMPRRLMDVTRLHALGWKHSIDLEVGIHDVVRDFCSRSGTES
jgi:GDP-L-fucose synthase